MAEAKIPGYKQNPPDWCDDCKSAGGEECPDCGCTHNCWKAGTASNGKKAEIQLGSTASICPRSIR